MPTVFKVIQRFASYDDLDSATPENVAAVRRAIETHNPKARIILADSEMIPDDAELIRSKRVLVVEDGPTLTHGNMAYGAGVIAAQRFGAAELIDPRPFLQGRLKETRWIVSGALLSHRTACKLFQSGQAVR